MRVRDIIKRPIRRRAGFWPLCVLVLALVIGVPGTALAEEIVVTTTVDRVDGDTSDLASLRANSGADFKVSLREAVMALRGEVLPATILVPEGVYILESSVTTVSVGLTPAVMGGPLDILASVRIVGAGTTIILPRVPAWPRDRIFDVDPSLAGGVAFELSGVTLTEGWANGAVGGGALRAGGTTDAVPRTSVTLTNCTLSNNVSVADTAVASSGGALNIGRNVDLTLRYCTFSENSAEGVGGALFVADSGAGSLTVVGCTFDSNISDGGDVSAGQGGAIYARVGTGGGTITSSTLTNNVATSAGTAGPDRGGALFVGGAITISDSRISHNVADEAAGAFGFLGTPLAEYNWWGTNSSPTTSTPACVVGGIDADPWLQLTINPDSMLLDKGASTGLTARVLSGAHMPPNDGTTVTFTGGSLGSATPEVVALASGSAASTFSAGQIAGPSVVTATYDGVVESVTVGVAGEPAVIAASETTFTVGAGSSVAITARGYPVPGLALQGALPSGLSFTFQGSTGATSSAGVIAGTPAAGTGGRYLVSIVATNGVEPDATVPMTVTVVEAPAFTSAETTTIAAGASITFDVTTSGFPLATISALDPLPGGLTLVDDGDGTARIAGATAAGAGGVYSVRLRADNAVTAAAEQTLTITVTEQPSFISSSSSTFVEGVADTFDIGTRGYPIPAVSVLGSLPSGVTFTDLGGGAAQLTGTPAIGTAGTYPLTLTADNGIGAPVTQSFTLTIDGPPTAGDRTGSCLEDGKAIIDVLIGASDPNDDPLSAELVGSPSNGSVVISASGTATYTPDPDFNGIDTFTYRVSAAGLYSAPATVTVTVNAVNDAPSFTPGSDVAVDEDSGAYSAGWATAISAGPANESGQSLGFGVVNDNAPLFASAPALAADGTLTFTPAADANGSAEVTVTLTDDASAGGAARSHIETFTITVNAINDAPSFTPGSDVTVDEDSGAYSAGWATAISAGPAEESAQTLAFILSDDNAALFSVRPTVAVDGTLTFTPAADANGSAEVIVTLTDDPSAGGAARSHIETFTITVNAIADAPVAVEDSLNCLEDASVSANIMDNDFDADGDSLTASLVSDVSHGALDLAPSGEVTYTPVPDWSGTDTFTYQVSDGTLSSAVTTVTITVVGTADAPIAFDDAYTATRNVNLVVGVSEGVLTNDVYVDLGVLQAALETAPMHGTVDLAADGSFTYVPDAGYWGTDTFTYRAHDETSTSEVATVTIDVDNGDGTPPLTTSNAQAFYVGSARIVLAATDDLTGVAWTKYRLDGGSVRTGTVVTITGIGEHTLTFWSQDVAGNLEAPHTISLIIYRAATQDEDDDSDVPTATAPVGSVETSPSVQDSDTVTGDDEPGTSDPHAGDADDGDGTDRPATSPVLGTLFPCATAVLALVAGLYVFAVWRRRRDQASRSEAEGHDGGA